MQTFHENITRNPRNVTATRGNGDETNTHKDRKTFLLDELNAAWYTTYTRVNDEYHL